MNTKQLMIGTLGTLLLAGPAVAQARQDQGQESVVEAARKAQAAKKTAPKAKIVLDNDNLDTLKGTVNVVGPEPAPPEDQTKADADKTKAGASTDQKKSGVKDEAYWRQAFTDANKKMADDAHELDILQREYNLKQQQFYSDPNTNMKEEFTRQDLTDTKARIDEKTAAVAADKQAISELEDALRQAGGDPAWAASAPAQPPAPEPATAPPGQ
jgi:chromosome segregation ATPase